MAINRDKVEAAAIKLLQQGKHDKAIVELKKLVEDDPTDVRTLLKLGDTYVKIGNKKESIDAYEKAAAIYTEQGFYLKAVAVFKQILRVDANIPELHLKLAELYQQLGLTSDALQHYQNVAIFYEQHGRARDALDMLKRMVDLDPDNIPSRIKLGELFAAQGLAAEASEELRNALNFLKQQQRYDDYVRVGEKLVAYDAGALDVAHELAQIYMQREQPQVALGKLQMCFKADPRNVEILSMIAQAFLAMQQVPKTISVYKEMAKIYVADGNGELATRTWERVLELVPDDEEAEQALGRVSAQVTVPVYGSKPTGVPTVVQPAMANAPMAQPAVSAARPNPEDEQLQRLLTETDVYVKYGLRDKAIEHIQKVFALRPDHIPALEKLKILQQAVGSRDVGETLARLVEAAEHQGHPRVDEWRAELQTAPSRPDAGPPRAATMPTLMVPVSRSASRSQSGEGDFLITDDPSQSHLPDEPIGESGVIALDDNASGIVELPADAPDEDLIAPSEGSLLDELPPDEEAFEAVEPRTVPRMPTGVMKSPVPAPLPPVAGRPVADDAVDLNDADDLVRRALQDISAEDVVAAADELLLEASADDVLSASGEGLPAQDDSFEEFEASTGPQRHAFHADTSASRSIHTSPTESVPEEDEIDRLAREAVADANKSLAADVASTVLMNLSDRELDEIGGFDAAPGSGAFAPQPSGSLTGPVPGRAPLPPELRDDDGGFDEPTLALMSSRSSDAPTDERPRRAPAAPVDEDAPTLFVKPSELMAQAVRSSQEGAAVVERPTTRAPAMARGAPPPVVEGELADEFDPSSFDLPADVKELLRNAEAPPPLELEPAGPAHLEPPASAKPVPAAPVPAGFDGGDGFGEPSGEITLRGKLGLADKAHGFENDPANQFFPDELEEAEFFIQQDLLDEAKDILTAILDDVPDSARVQWMLARVEAKEQGEAEPPAPWEQRILEEVQAQLEDLGLGEEAGTQALEELAPGTAQISVEEVLSQFKKGVAETVPEDDAATHYELGIAYKEMGLHDDAVGEFQIASRAASRAVDARYMIGAVRREQGRLEDAVAAFEEAAAQPSATRNQKAAADYDRGVCLDELGRGKDAVRALKSAKSNGHAAPDLDRRVAALVAKYGDVPSGEGNGVNGANGHAKPDKGAPGRGPKNIDYV